MNISDAINDPNRPLSVPAQKWLEEMTQRRGSIKEAAEPKKTNEDSPEEQALEKIEQSVDAIVAAIKTFYEGIDVLEKVDLPADEKKVLSNVKDLLDTAIAPYMADIIKELDSLEEE